MPTSKPALLLLYLASRDDWVSRDELALLFQPDTELSKAKRQLRLYLTRARKFSWAAGLEQHAKRLRFRPESDLRDFRRALGRADWQTASLLYRGDFLENLRPADSVAYESWLDVERAALARAWQEATMKHIALLLKAKSYDQAASLSARVLAHDPLAEDVLQTYLRSSYLAGKPAQALHAYTTFKRRLQDELALEPLEETQTLVTTIQRAEALQVGAEPAHRAPLSVLRPPVMVGRYAEGQVLSRTGAHVGIISGEAGVGKSRLVSELAQDAIYLRCRESLANIPYFPLIEALEGLERPAGLEAYEAELKRLTTGAGDPGDDSGTAQAKLLEALVHVFKAPGRPIIVEDVQWADSASLAFIGALIHHPVKLLITLRQLEGSQARQDFIEGLQHFSQVQTLELEPLDQASIVELIRSLSPETGDAPAFAAWLKTKTGGNPFFILETLRALFETQVLQETESGWYSSLDQVTTAYADLALPPGVSAIIQRRIRALSDEEKRVLDIATVLGEGIQAERIADLAGMSIWAASDALEQLERRGLIEGERFSHDLARQVLYRSLPQSRKQFLHRRIADGLEDELVRAEHYHLGGDDAQAAALWFHAARFRFSAGNFEREAEALYERILSLDIETADSYRAKAYLAGRYIDANRLDEANQLIGSVLDKSDDTLARAFALLQKIKQQFMAGEMGLAEASLQQAEQLITQVDDPGIKRDVALFRVYLDQYAGRYTQALELAKDILAQKRRELPDFGLINWLSTVAIVQCNSGQFEDALAVYQEQLAVARKLGARRSQVQAASDIMATLYDLGRIQEGLDLGEKALELGDFDVTYPLRYHLALAYFEQNRFDDVLAQCEAIFAGKSSINIRSHSYALLAETFSVQGQVSHAYKAIDDGLELIKSIDHTDATAVLLTAALKFGSHAQQAHVLPAAKALAEKPLPAYLQRAFDEALTKHG